MKKFVSIFVLISIIGVGCTDRDDEVAEVNLRIKNVSSLIFDEVIVGEAVDPHLNVTPDSYSEYFIYETAYTYAFIQITSGEETFVLQPIDFVGETPLPIGFYTYELDVSDTGEVLLNFVID
ncbi:MAG: hypothetical protein HKN89_09075 [Eudoraea sp.]|nr:hypothetical protein [Eudoraea sp.]